MTRSITARVNNCWGVGASGGVFGVRGVVPQMLTFSLYVEG